LLDPRQDRAPANAKVQYLCDHYPDLLHMSNNRGLSQLMYHLIKVPKLDLKTVTIMCEGDKTIRSEIRQSPEDSLHSLHLLVQNRTFFSGVEADYFCYLLNLYPAAAGNKDGIDMSPYDIAIAKNIDVYFIRLLLNADLIIDHERRRDLYYAARKEATFLAYRAISRNKKASIWKRLRALYGGSEHPTLLAHVISHL
jgi:hypothetical protein